MSYLDLINNFWQKDYEFSFSADQVNMYFRLLKHANVLGWKKPRFNLAVDKLMLEVGLKTKRPFDTARKGLRDAGLIDFVNGNGRGCTTEYCLIGAERVAERDAPNSPLSATLSASIPQSFREENVPLHKNKIKNKTKEANASARAGKKSCLPPTAPPPPEPWAAWIAEHAPTVQRLPSPLTAKQWDKLVADFTEPIVQQVLLAMENKADLLKKYRSANLTVREWCGRRLPALTAQPHLPDGPPAPIEPDLNPAVLAANQAQQQAQVAERARQFRAKHAPEPVS